ncbi:MAG: hypothetical protein ACE5QV_08430, partial [Fidelibacterota bacterium]
MGDANRGSKKPYLWGVAGALILLSIYFLIVSLANSFSHAVEEFISIWYWITLLIAGFGIQVGLYVHLRELLKVKHEAKGATSSVATAGSVSTVSMVACCAHHLTDILPIIGLSAAAIFLSKYQLIFIFIGLLSNMMGTTYMLKIIQIHNLYRLDGPLSKILKLNMGRLFKLELPFSIAVLIIVSVISFYKPSPLAIQGDDLEAVVSVSSDARRILPETKSDYTGEIMFDVTPVKFDAGKPVVFEVMINTHTTDLDFEVDKISFLIDEDGKEHRAERWSGSPSGGHHRKGVLYFPPLRDSHKFLMLVIDGGDKFGRRVFEW